MTEGDTEDFAALFAASQRTRRVDHGQTVEGTIVALGADVAFVSIGAKSEATIALAELRAEDGTLDLNVGDRIQATVMSTTGGVTLSRTLQRRAATARQLEDAFRAGLPVEGKVESQVKGGYAVTIARQRAFCPISQIDIVRDTDAATHLGRIYPFRIIEYKDGGRQFVVSRRALLDEERKRKADQLRQSLAVGAVVTGQVVSVRDFGAFVDLGGGVQGLLHVSEMGWSRVGTPAEVVTQGQQVTVKVIRLDGTTGQIALSLKQLLADPWSKVAATYAVGQVRDGRVTRLADFGAFVELEPGIEGLAHASTFAPTGTPHGWARTVPIGTTAPFEIVSIDAEKKRIGLSLVDERSAKYSAAATAARQEAEDVREYASRAHATQTPNFGGSLADKLRGVLKR